MKPPRAHVDVELEVPFHDVDSLQIVWHGHYYKYAEIGRTALMRARGLDVQELLGLGAYVVVIESKCRYAFPLRYGERFRVRSWVEECDLRVVIGFEITNLTHNRRSARGHTTLAALSQDGRLLLETPDAIRSRLA